MKPNCKVNIKGNICADPGARAVLKYGSAASRLLYCGIESCRVHGCLSLANGACCWVEVSTPGDHSSRWVLQCGVSECDLETSTRRRPRPTRAVKPWKINASHVHAIHHKLKLTYILTTEAARFKTDKTGDITHCFAHNTRRWIKLKAI